MQTEYIAPINSHTTSSIYYSTLQTTLIDQYII